MKQTIFDYAFIVKPSQLSVLVDLQRIFLNEDLRVGEKELFFVSFVDLQAIRNQLQTGEKGCVAISAVSVTLEVTL